MASFDRLLALLAVYLVFTGGLLVYACNYGATCEEVELGGTTLTASCKAANGDLVTSSLDLNAKIGNHGGYLYCPDSNFGTSCEDIRLRDRHVLIALCRTPSGEYRYTTLDLNSCIGNNNGHLQFCVDSRGSLEI